MTTTALATQAERAVKFIELQAKAATRLTERAAELTVESMKNMPEYAEFPWIQCTEYDYDNNQYTFKVANPDGEGDVEDDTPEVTVTTDELAKTMPMFYMAVLAGILPGLCITDETFWDAGNWDAQVLDCFLQYHFYNDTIFG